MVLDLSKRELLESVILPQIASNRSLQRLLNKYQVLLDEIQTQSLVPDEFTSPT